MRLKRLELQGFKSFLDRTILTFDEGITGVVGPNGCGKSNIVDAIQWVMGEQSAKHLRGNAMQDVIFNGSDKQAPTSMAEVTLVLDKEGASLPASLIAVDRGEEVGVTRRLYRDGTSEYLINKTVCRLKDIHELFMDTGIGKRAYSIIEQGQIDRMVNVKPEDRRYIFEEVAGITKYRTKRKEAERKLEQTQTNLSRLHDIIAELEKRMRSLKVQASRAKKYKDIKVELETADLFYLGRKLYKCKTQIHQKEEEKLSLEEQKSEFEATFAKCDAQITELDIKRIDQEKQAEGFERQAHEYELELEKLQSQKDVLGEKRKYLLESQENAQTEISLLASKKEEKLLQSQEGFREKDELEHSIGSLKSKLAAAKSLLEELSKTRFELENQTRSLQAEISQLAQDEVDLKNQKEYLHTRLEEAEAERTKVNEELGEAAKLMETQKAEILTTRQKVEECEQKSEITQKEVSSAHEQCQLTSGELTEVQNKLYQTQERFHGENSRLVSLKELAENLEGYSPTAREILGKLKESSIVATPLAELLQPEPRVEKTLELLLGDALNTIIVKTQSDARHLAALVCEKDLEKVGVLALEELENYQEPSFDRPTMVAELKGKVRVVPGYEGVLHWALNSTYLVEGLSDFFSLRQSYPQCTFVSENLSLISHNDRLITCGKMATQSGIFERRREIESLEVVVAQAKVELEQLELRRTELYSKLENEEKLQVELKEKLSAIHIESVGARSEHQSAKAELERIDKRYNTLIEKSQANEAQLEKLRIDRANASQKYDDASTRKLKSQEQLGDLEESLSEATLRHQTELTVKNEQEIELSKIEERYTFLSQKLTQVESEIAEISDRSSRLSEKYEKDKLEIEGIDIKEKEFAEISSQKRDLQNQVFVQISELKTLRDETAHEINHLKSGLSEAAKNRDALNAKLQSLEIALANSRNEFENQNQISIERYQRECLPLDESAPLDLEKLPLFTSQRKFEWESLPVQDREAMLEAHLVDIRKKVERYGEVNLTAINEYEEVEERAEFLQKQKDDLDGSIKMLEEAIERIDTTTVDRFRETVEQVNAKFKEVFPILFGGGKAELTLTNPESILESGVDIMVQPPGKRLQSISLLSGGEKALTATSLILAIFARKPSPFCLLDEVDAPLDDANVSRFNTVVKYMSQKSQFIIITHNRRTMEVADVLYGVTMQRSGISKMTGVSLH